MSTCSLEIKQYSFHKSHWTEAQLPLWVGGDLQIKCWARPVLFHLPNKSEAASGRTFPAPASVPAAIVFVSIDTAYM